MKRIRNQNLPNQLKTKATESKSLQVEDIVDKDRDKEECNDLSMKRDEVGKVSPAYFLFLLLYFIHQAISDVLITRDS